MAGIILAAGMSFGSCSKHNNNGGGGNTVTPLGGYVSSDSVASANLVAYFTFDNNVNDIRGNETGTANHASYITGIRGQAYQGSDSTSYATVPANAALAGLKSFSLSLWYSMPSAAKVQPGTRAAGMFFVSGSNTQNDGNEIMMETDIPSANQLATDSVSIHHGFNNIGGVANSWQNFTMVSFDTSVATWVHVVMTYDGGSSTYIFYQNGNPIAVSSAYGVSSSSILYDGPLPVGSGSPATQLQGNLSFAPDAPKTIYIGTWPPNLYGVSPSLGATGGFKGALDEVRIFNRALSQSEVAGLYLNGKAGR